MQEKEKKKREKTSKKVRDCVNGSSKRLKGEIRGE